MNFLVSNQYTFAIRFQNNQYAYVFFNDTDKSMREVAEYLKKNRTLLIKDIKIYEPHKTRFRRLNLDNFRCILCSTTELEQELITRNIYKP